MYIQAAQTRFRALSAYWRSLQSGELVGAEHHGVFAVQAPPEYGFGDTMGKWANKESWESVYVVKTDTFKKHSLNEYLALLQNMRPGRSGPRLVCIQDMTEIFNWPIDTPEGESAVRTLKEILAWDTSTAAQVGVVMTGGPPLVQAFSAMRVAMQLEGCNSTDDKAVIFPKQQALRFNY